MCKFSKELYVGESFADWPNPKLGSSTMIKAFTNKSEALDAEASDMECSPSEVKVGVYKLVRIEKRMMKET